jgi:molybdopterin converting factor small subunit
VLIVEVRIRFGTSIARFAPAPVMALELPAGATVADLYDQLSGTDAGLADALRSALPIVGGVHVERGQTLAPGDEVALLTAISGG